MFEEMIDQLNRDFENLAPISSSLTDADLVEIVSTLPERAGTDPKKEVEQHLYLAPDGEVTFRSYTAGKGKGKRGIGRYIKERIPRSSVMEILQLLDTFLFLNENRAWEPDEEKGSWMVRAARKGSSAEMTRGSLEGAAVDGMDLSFMIRMRVPIEGLILFDPVTEEGADPPDTEKDL